MSGILTEGQVTMASPGYINDGYDHRWKLSAPFIYVIDLSKKKTGASIDDYPLSGKSWQTIIGTLSGFADQFFISGHGANQHPDISSIIESMEGTNRRYHLTTDFRGGNASNVVGMLRKLKRLDRLRVPLDRFPPERDSPVAKGMRYAIDAGLTVWAVVPFTSLAEPRGFFEERQMPGLGGLSCAIDTRTDPGGFPFSEDLIDLSKNGFPVYYESCLPIESVPSRTVSCDWAEGYCRIDAQGNVTICSHNTRVLGNVLKNGIEDVWGGLCTAKGTSVPQGPARSMTRDAFSIGQYSPVLDGDLVPFPCFRVRDEPYGALLIKDYDFVMVSPRARRILTFLDGKHTLHDIDDTHGNEAISFAFALFARNMIRFKKKQR